MTVPHHFIWHCSSLTTLLCPSLSWRPLCVGSSPNMTGLSLLTQGDWAEGTTAHNGGTMAAPLVLMGDTCNRISVRTPGGGGDHMGRWYTRPTPSTPPCPVPLHQTCTKPRVCLEGRVAAHHDVCHHNLQNVCRQLQQEI